MGGVGFISLLQGNDYCRVRESFEEQGCRNGESARLPPMRPEFKWFSAICELSLLLVLALLRGFFSGFSGFPLSTKTNISRFKFDQDSGLHSKYCYFLFILLSKRSAKRDSQRSKLGLNKLNCNLFNIVLTRYRLVYYYHNNTC